MLPPLQWHIAGTKNGLSGRSTSYCFHRCDAAGGLLGTDEDDAQGAATLGDVQQDVLDGAVPLARGVLVELVEDDEGIELSQRYKIGAQHESNWCHLSHAGSFCCVNQS